MKSHRSVGYLAGVGVVVVAAGALAGCGGGHSPVASAPPATGSTVTTTTTTGAVPATTAPGSTVTTTTTGAVPATTAPAMTVPSPAAGRSATSSTGSGGPALIVRSFDGTVGYDGREPSTIGFSGDSSNIVTHLSWTKWGPVSAVGEGLLGVNDCEPSCAAGTVTQVLATVDLAKVVDGHFTAMSEKAGSLSHSYSYPTNWAATAS